MAKLNSPQKTTLRKSSGVAIQRAFASLRRPFSRRTWLWSNNVYRKNCIQALWNHTQPGFTINTTNLAEYIAASAPLHCADGWSFLGRALACHTYGDSDTARHLGYYAELRAAMSLLATEGVGVFDKKHFVVETSGNCQLIPKATDRGRQRWLGTHEVAWHALEHWANRRHSTDILAEIIQPGGIPLRDWLQALSTGSSWRPVGSKWLETWGLDLRRLTDDREARNAASYRPTHLTSVISLDTSESFNFLHNMWQLFEPSSDSSFEILDRHLLRLSLELGFEAITGKKPKAYPADFEIRIDSILKTLALRESHTQRWKSFLTRNAEHADPSIITEAQQKIAINHPRHHIQVLSRATLLLRVATGACAQLLRKAGFGSEDLRFWWNPFGIERGLWDAGDEPTRLMDLWADVEVALKEVRGWDANNAGAKTSYVRWRRESAQAISVLAECERIALWGLCL